MRPRPDEILTSVIASYEQYVLPEVTEPFAQSIALTIANLLRHVKLRIQLDGPALTADNEEVRALLAAIGAFATERGLDDLRDEAAAPPEGDAPSGYQTLEDLADTATDLRWALQRSLRQLEALRPTVGDDPAYQELRTDIRRYLRRSLEREMAVVVPAFTGERR